MNNDVPFNPNVKDGRGTVGLAIPKSNWANILDTPPFEAYAVSCGITFTFGGLKIDSSARVVDTDGQVIPGLYAAGELVGGLFYFNYPGGTGLMSGAVFGSIAGTSAGSAPPRCHERRRGTEAIFDVVVVGGGGSGLAAAIEARASRPLGRPAREERELGGSTAWSIGSITCERHAAPAPPGHPGPARTITARHGRASLASSTRATTTSCAASCATRCPTPSAGCSRIGVRFYGPMPEPPHGKPRMHNVLPNSLSYIYHLGGARAPRRRRYPCSTRAAERLLAEAGRVVGVDCETPQGKRRFRARGGVVLASGDFTNDPELKARSSWGRSRPRSKASTSLRPATARSWRSPSARASSTAIWRSVPRCASSRRASRTLVLQAAALAGARQPDGMVARAHAERCCARSS